MTELEEQASIQTIKQIGEDAPGSVSFWLSIQSEADGVPPYWSHRRDSWLREFTKRVGNDMLAGTIATIVAKVATTNWYLEGPERTARIYRQLLLTKSNFGAGWSQFIQQFTEDYLTQDQGGWSERIRQHGPLVFDENIGFWRVTNLNDRGGALGFAHLDNAKVVVTGDPTYPAIYTDEDGREIALDRSQIMRITDSPSPDSDFLGVGYCAVSRAITTARILMDVARYDREKLSDLPPAGILAVNNMTREQWKDIEKQYDVRQRQQGNNVWRDILVAVGLNPTLPVSIEMFSFSEVPAHFDKRTYTEIGAYSFALAFRIDPREIWPVSGGQLGTGTETAIMHLKAKAKGAGLILTDIERVFNDKLSLPPSLTFHFDYQDSEEDKQAAEIANLKADFITKLTKLDQATGESLVSLDQGRQWLVKEGFFTEDELFTIQEEERQMDVEQARSLVDMGPCVRVYNDGRLVRLERERRVWSIPPALEMVAKKYARNELDPGELAEFALSVAIERMSEGVNADI